jgi:hypothetical protein
MARSDSSRRVAKDRVISGALDLGSQSPAGRRHRRFISATCSGVMAVFPGGPVNHSTMRFHSASMISMLLVITK